MTPGDFRESTPDEFTAICDAWSEGFESIQRADWERMRTLAALTVQPHVKGRITPRRLVPLPWDEPARMIPGDAPRPTAEEDLKRFTELVGKS